MKFRASVRAIRHPLRAFALGLAALALTSQFAMSEAVVASVIGSVLGVALGEWLGRSKWRTEVVLSAVAGSLLLVWLLTALLLRGESVADALGPGTSLRTFGIIRYFVTSLAVVSAVRALVVRKQTFIVLELVMVVGAVAFALAAHRDGVIARPLWLSDWAWQAGLDPVHVLLAIGGLAIVVLALLLLAEREGEVSIASLVALPVLALIAVLIFTTSALPQPKPASDINLTDHGESPQTPPQVRDAGVPHQPGSGPDGGARPQEGDGGAGQNPDASSGQQDPHTTDAGIDGGSSARDAAVDGGGSSARDAGTDGGGSSGGDASVDGGASQGRDAATDAGGSAGAQDGGIDGGTQQRPPDGGNGSNAPPSDGGASGQSQRQSETDQESQRNDIPQPSSAPMAVVLLDNDYSPPSGAYYFRQGVWSEFNGHRLIESSRTDADQDVIREYPTQQVRVRESAPTRGRVIVTGRVALVVEHNGPFALESEESLAPSSNPNASRFVRAFRFTSRSQTVPYQQLLHARVGNPAWTPDVRAHYLKGPTDPRYAALAHEIVNGMPEARRADPFAQAVAVKLYLDHNLTYSTRHRHAGVDDPVADLLFGDRTGYCVHFAHSAVYLWRALGIPARVGNGYHSDEQNRRGGSAILLRGSDAHAWPEIYVEGYGWIVLDIAAERNLDPPGQPTDEDLQRMLGEMAREEQEDPADPPPKKDDSLPWLKIFLWTSAILLGLALLALYFVKIWRLVVPSFAKQKTIARLGYRSILDSLSHVGYTRDVTETREVFAERVAQIAPSFRELTTRNIAAALRASGDDLSRPEFDVAGTRAIMRAVRKEIRANTTFWKRLLGAINPISFFSSK
ncbi:MAG: hypothetical protein IPK60_23885 [Sandaracinaceae bacterium]|nr:hypothetical protein [Sandaracinaceae bacterium]